jgi:hypothetical protein
MIAIVRDATFDNEMEDLSILSDSDPINACVAYFFFSQPSNFMIKMPKKHFGLQ